MWWCLIYDFFFCGDYLFFFFLLFSLSKQKCIFLTFSFCFSILVLGLFIAYFNPLPFEKVFDVFNFVFKLQFVIDYQSFGLFCFNF